MPEQPSSSPERIQPRALWGYAAAVASALLVGVFTVLNKWILEQGVAPLAGAAWTYSAAGVALLPWALRARGLSIRRWPIIIAWLLAGSVVGPALYFVGLKFTSGVEGVLMINMEALFTALLAFFLFRERLTVKTAIAGLAILAGGIWLSWPSKGASLFAGNGVGNALIAAGYLGWATENNLGRLLGKNIPTASLVCLKALVAGTAMGILAPAFGQHLVVPTHAIPALAASGALCLGLSLAFYYWAMQKIGAARTGLISATSVFWGVAVALVLLHESLTMQVVAGGILMVLGLAGFAAESTASEKNSATRAQS